MAAISQTESVSDEPGTPAGRVHLLLRIQLGQLIFWRVSHHRQAGWLQHGLGHWLACTLHGLWELP